MSKFIHILMLMLAALAAASQAHAQKSQFEQEGNVWVRFYIDKSLERKINDYDDLRGYIMASIQEVGLYSLGIRFTRDTRHYVVDSGNADTPSEMDAFMATIDSARPDKPRTRVNIFLTHKVIEGNAAGVAFSGRRNLYVRTRTNDSDALLSRSAVRDTAIHELGHSLGHGGLYPEYSVGDHARCRTNSQPKPIMCHAGRAGRTDYNIRTRNYTLWTYDDVVAVKQYSFGSGYPRTKCYEFRDVAQCQFHCSDRKCVFSQLHPVEYDACYNSCMNTECRNICL